MCSSSYSHTAMTCKRARIWHFSFFWFLFWWLQTCFLSIDRKLPQWTPLRYSTMSFHWHATLLFASILRTTQQEYRNKLHQAVTYNSEVKNTGWKPSSWLFASALWWKGDLSRVDSLSGDNELSDAMDQFQLFPIPVQRIHSWRHGIMPSLALAVTLTSDERVPVRVIGGLESLKGKIAIERWKKKIFLLKNYKSLVALCLGHRNTPDSFTLEIDSFYPLSCLPLMHVC